MTYVGQEIEPPKRSRAHYSPAYLPQPVGPKRLRQLERSGTLFHDWDAPRLTTELIGSAIAKPGTLIPVAPWAGYEEAQVAIETPLPSALGVDPFHDPRSDHQIDGYGVLMPAKGGGLCVSGSQARFHLIPNAIASAYMPLVASLHQRGIYFQIPIRGYVHLEWGRAEDPRLQESISIWLPVQTGAVPHNPMPSVPYALLPEGERIAVTKTIDHTANLERYLANDCTSYVVCTLHSVTIDRPRSSYKTVEVRIDGQRVGELTAHRAKSVLPLVEMLLEQGKVPAVSGEVDGTRMNPQVVLSSMTTKHLTNELIQSLQADEF